MFKMNMMGDFDGCMALLRSALLTQESKGLFYFLAKFFRKATFYFNSEEIDLFLEYVDSHLKEWQKWENKQLVVYHPTDLENPIRDITSSLRWPRIDNFVRDENFISDKLKKFPQLRGLCLEQSPKKIFHTVTLPELPHLTMLNLHRFNWNISHFQESLVDFSTSCLEGSFEEQQAFDRLPLENFTLLKDDSCRSQSLEKASIEWIQNTPAFMNLKCLRVQIHPYERIFASISYNCLEEVSWETTADCLIGNRFGHLKRISIGSKSRLTHPLLRRLYTACSFDVLDLKRSRFHDAYASEEIPKPKYGKILL